MSNPQQLPIYIKLYQLTKYLYERRRNFPKEYKYTFGDDLVALNWSCLDIFLEAHVLSGADKLIKIQELSVVFDKLKLRLRMGQELKIISEKQFVHIQEYYIGEIGCMIGGWENANNISNDRQIGSLIKNEPSF